MLENFECLKTVVLENFEHMETVLNSEMLF